MSNLHAIQMMIFLLLLPLIQASSSAQNSNSPLPNSTGPTPLVFESACSFLAPLANYSFESLERPLKDGRERLNLPLVKSSGEKINFLVLNGKELSYNILGQEHKYIVTDMEWKEKYFNCDCLTKIESPGEFLKNEQNKICTELDCTKFSRLVDLKKEVISLLSKYKLVNFPFQTLSDFLEEGILTSQEHEYLNRVKEKREVYNQKILDTMQTRILSRVREDLIPTEKNQKDSCLKSKGNGKFLEFEGNESISRKRK